MSLLHKCTIIIGYIYGQAGNLGFPQGSGPILLGYLNCTGEEASLLECSQSHNLASTSSACQNHSYDGAVKCERKQFDSLINL